MVKKKQKVIHHILLLLISPYIALYRLLKGKNQQITVISGMLLMGIIGSIYYFTPGSDGATHLEKVNTHYVNLSGDEFLREAINILTFQSIEISVDLYIHCLGYLAGGIFGIPELLHVFAGFVLGYFYTKSVILVLKDKQKNLKAWWIIAFIAMFLVVRSISALNSIRMWTGMWILFYGSYSYALTRNKKYVWIALSSIIVHFSYSIFVFPVIFGYIMRHRKMLITFLFLASFFFSLNYNLVSAYLPENRLTEVKTETYVQLEEEGGMQGENKLSQTNFYKKYGPNIYYSYSLIALSIILILFNFKYKLSEATMFLIAAGLMLYALSNIMEFSGLLQGRSKGLSSTFITAANLTILTTLRYYGISRLHFVMGRFFLVLVLLSCIPYFLFHFSYALNMLSIFFFAFPFVSWIIGDGDLSIRDFLVLLFGG